VRWSSAPLASTAAAIAMYGAQTFGIEQTAYFRWDLLWLVSGDTPQMRTLRRALKICGGVRALAHALDSSIGDLLHWLDGHAVPTPIYIVALDLVAGGRDTGR
jgi:hypothetical protein